MMFAKSPEMFAESSNVLAQQAFLAIRAIA